MTPAERVVVGQAIAYICATTSDPTELIEAVDALLAERESGEPTDQERRWADVVIGDEIYSEKTRKWYPVKGSASIGQGRVKVIVQGLPRPVETDGAKPVRVKRGPDGQAVDMFASVLWSGEARS